MYLPLVLTVVLASNQLVDRRIELALFSIASVTCLTIISDIRLQYEAPKSSRIASLFCAKQAINTSFVKSLITEIRINTNAKRDRLKLTLYYQIIFSPR
ncbi:hypothetical protein G4B88_015930 [Cannabis sativa]|uniref:Uncharacterized protein n=1 Tax=Cannabis sativa TaxID=3483 RepID=A0A7J6EJP5_CANSA|nr:hypothetical protein G4B88_015930 [Cannabis sativa]